MGLPGQSPWPPGPGQSTQPSPQRTRSQPKGRMLPRSPGTQWPAGLAPKLKSDTSPHRGSRAVAPNPSQPPLQVMGGAQSIPAEEKGCQVRLAETRVPTTDTHRAHARSCARTGGRGRTLPPSGGPVTVKPVKGHVKGQGVSTGQSSASRSSGRSASES